MQWATQEFDTVDKLFRALIAFRSNDTAFRGQALLSWHLESSLDRNLDSGVDYRERLAREESIFVEFRERAMKYFGRIENAYLNASQSISVPGLTLLQHYGAPTRVLDWTHSPWIALYYAAIHHHDEDGAVWWFKTQEFEPEVHQRWSLPGMPSRPGNSQINLEQTAFKTDGLNWITNLYCPVPFARLELQQGFFTVAGRLGSDHGELIAGALDASPPSIFVVPSQLKKEILDRLRLMNVHATSLGYPGADHVGAELTASLRRGVES